MLSSFEPDHVERNMAALVAAVAPGDDEASLRTRFHRALAQVQRWKPPFGTDGEPLVDFDLEHPEVQAALRDIVGRADPAAVRITGEERERRARDIAAGAERLAAYDSGAARSLQLLAATILVLRGEGMAGGSATGLIGTIWLFPDDRWDPVRFAENLLHESVHLALFLDEMINTLYVVDHAALEADDALVTSAIRRVRRPYDRSLHAACVAVELIDYHEHAGNAEAAARMREGVAASTVELADKARVLSPHGREVLAELIERSGVAA